MQAAVVRSLLVGMTGGASNFLWSGFVRGVLYVGMAIDAGEHAAVDGIFEGLRIDMQADSFAVDFVSQRRVAMTRQALVGRGFGRIFFGRCLERARG